MRLWNNSKNKPEAIRNGLHQFIAMDELERKKMGQKGKDFVKKFTYEKLSKNILKFLTYWILNPPHYRSLKIPTPFNYF